jgi:hypothetical protein
VLLKIKILLLISHHTRNLKSGAKIVLFGEITQYNKKRFLTHYIIFKNTRKFDKNPLPLQPQKKQVLLND